MPAHRTLLRYTLAVTLLAFAARLIYFLLLPHAGLLEGDSRDYIRLAGSLAHGHYTVPGAFSGGFPVDLNRPPGYPAFLMAANLGGDISAPATALVQLSLGALFAGGLTYAIGRWLDPFTGLLAGLMLAFDWSTVINTPLVLADTPFAMVYAGAFALLALATIRQRWRYALLGGIALGVATLIKPIGLVGLVAVGVVVLLAPRRRWRALLCVAGLAVVVMPWVVRNDNRYGVANVSTISTVNLYAYTARGVLQSGYLFSTGTAGGGVNQADQATAPLRRQHLTTAQLSSRMTSQAVDIITSHLPKAAVQELWGALHVMLGTGRETVVASTGDDALPSPLVSWLPLAQILVMWALAAYGTVIAWRGGVERGALLLLLLGIAFVILAAGGPAGYGRYRLPATPMECVLAAIGAASLLARARARSGRTAPVVPHRP